MIDMAAHFTTMYQLMGLLRSALLTCPAYNGQQASTAPASQVVQTVSCRGVSQPALIRLQLVLSHLAMARRSSCVACAEALPNSVAVGGSASGQRCGDQKQVQHAPRDHPPRHWLPEGQRHDAGP